ncbi:MAG: hypothetical protein JKY96_04235 [Phycisphaerales bacterium]|nr:hypothetical protein [Phycisphaerales bacterium]
MTYITPSQTGSVSGVGRIHTERTDRTESRQEDVRSGASRGADQALLSPVSRYLSELKAGPPVRTDLVARVKQEIDAETYETSDKFDAILDDVAQDVDFDADSLFGS